jgi:glucose-6-phosphate isomerase/transaldolase/glucose-6-phosphate isomerase
LPEGEPILEEKALRVYGNLEAENLEGALKSLFGSAVPGDYCALLAYVTENDVNAAKIAAGLRRPLQRRLKLATTLGYGPRYLHSTGQLHKGGPGTGIYLVLTADASNTQTVPGRDYSFDSLQRAQAVGDLQALQNHGRRVLRIHLGAGVPEGLDRLGAALQNALG